MENIKKLFERIKAIGFWKRLFHWESIIDIMYRAHEDFRLMEFRMDQKDKELNKVISHGNMIDVERKSLREQLTKRENEHAILSSEHERVVKELTKLESLREQESKEHSDSLSKMMQAKLGYEDDRKRMNDQRLEEEQERMELMKQTWSVHETDVKRSIQRICMEHVIQYVEKTPFRGNPDNTIQVCGEHIIFDAKSPQGEDLSNFPVYVRSQAEAISKYTKQESVKKDIYLVVPTNTIEVLKESTFDMGDYTVYVITKDALEPVILSHKKVEEYEYIDQLSPEDRQSICRIIGKFYHTSRRKIQVDHFMSLEMLEILRRCELDLPEEFHKAVMAFDKAEFLNPPSERRNKQITIRELERSQEKVEAEAKVRSVKLKDGIIDRMSA